MDASSCKLPAIVHGDDDTFQTHQRKLRKFLDNDPALQTPADLFTRTVQDLMIVTTPSSTVIWANQGALHILGLEKEEDLVGKSFMEFIHPDDIEPTGKALQFVLETTDIRYFQNRYRHADGSYVRLEWNAQIHGDYLCGCARVKDEVDEYLSAVTHNLRTPLNSIMGFTQLLKRRKTLKKTDLQFIEYIDSASKQLLEIVDTVLEDSRTKAEGFKTETFCLHEVLADICQQMSGTMREHKVILQLHRSHLGNRVTAEKSKFVHALQNLINNAVKYNVPNGEVRVEGHLDGTNNTIVITVHDTGVGISPAFMQHLFVPFKREHKNIKGTGVGLTMCKKTFELFGGSIRIESTPGLSTTVYVTLPAVEPFRNDWDTTVDLFGFLPSMRRKTILYVDDDPFNIILVREFINSLFGENVLFDSAGSVHEAIGKLENTPDLLLLDLHLPDGTGVDVYDHVKSIAAKSPDKRLPAIWFLTADTGIAQMEVLKGKGVGKYLLKPLKMDRLEKELRETFPDVPSPDSSSLQESTAAEK